MILRLISRWRTIDMRRYLILTVLVVILCSRLAYAVELTLSIQGSIDDISRIIELLRQAGIGYSTQQSSEDPFRIHIYSSSEAVQEEVKESPSLGFQEIRGEPENPVAGTPLKIFAKPIDPLKIIDTISANIFGTNINADLRDDGQNGDEIAGDGIWTGMITLPVDVYGSKTILLTAFDDKGKIIQQKMSDGTVKPVIGTLDCVIQASENK
mgnify:CR=1 FL=1